MPKLRFEITDLQDFHHDLNARFRLVANALGGSKKAHLDGFESERGIVSLPELQRKPTGSYFFNFTLHEERQDISNLFSMLMHNPGLKLIGCGAY